MNEKAMEQTVQLFTLLSKVFKHIEDIKLFEDELIISTKEVEWVFVKRYGKWKLDGFSGEDL